MIEIKNLTKIYKSKHKMDCKALDNISFSLPDKGFVFIVGKSGSGKSTLLNMISGLDSFTSGDIIADGNSFNEMSKTDFDKYLSSYVGFVFQDYRLIDDFTIKQNIEIALDISGEKNNISYYLDKIGLQGHENRYPTELSGGQKQRVAIVRAIIKNPQIILADEPTGNLDSVTTIQVLNLLKEISKEKLVIVVSHDMNDAFTYADRIIELADGKIVKDRSKKEGYRNMFEIVDNIAYLPHHKDLSKRQIASILKNKKSLIKIVQKNSGFIPTKEQIIQTKKVDFKANKISKSNKKKLFSIFFKRRKFSKVLTVFLSAVLISLFYVIQAFVSFDSNRSTAQDLIYNNKPSVELTKAYKPEQGTSLSNYTINYVDDSDIEAFKDVYPTGNIYKMFNNTISIMSYSVDGGTILNIKSNCDEFYIKETYGVLNCDESFLIDLYGNENNELEYLSYNEVIKDYGIFISDYVADSMMFYNPKKYQSYEDVLGEYQYKGINKVYINGVFNSNYKEKYSDLFNSFSSLIGDMQSSVENDDFAAFITEVANYLGVAYNFNSDYENAIQTLEFKDLLTIERSCAYDENGKESYRGAMYIVQDSNKKYDLKSNEVVMNITTYNTLFNTEYTSKNYKEFIPHKFTYKKSINPNFNNFFFEKELYIKAITPEKVYTTVADEVFLEFIKCDVYCYSLYFDNVEHSMELLKVAEERQYSFSPVASISNLSLVTRSIEILGSFLRIIEIALLIACTFYLGSFGIRSIKSNMYEIGVIKSLGGSNKDIGKIFVIQNLIVGIGVVLLSVLGMYIAAKVSNEILIQSFKTVLNTTIKSIKLVQFYPTLVVIDLFIAVILIIVSSFIPTRFLRKVRPIDILKAKE